jgi:RNA polymerase sigma factor (sigma-70 family)
MTKGRLRAGPYTRSLYFPQLQPGPHLQSPQSQFVHFMVLLSFHACRRATSAFITLRAVTTEALVENHRKFLAFVEKRVGDRALAEDILQDAFVKSLEKQHEIRDDATAVAWFYQLLRNSIVDQYRRRATRSKALEALAMELKDAVEPPPELRGAICDCVSEIASTLKPEYAAAIRRVDLDEVPVQTFASEAGITANNAAVRLFRAREALRKQVKAACGTCAEHGCADCTCVP